MSMQPDHPGMQARMHAALWSPVTPEGLGAAEGLEQRFAVYRNNVQHGLARALAQRFPVVERLVGAEFFAAMARVFAAAHPPATPVLLDWGEGFADFLAGFAPVRHLAYLPDVARLEWARGLAYHAADVAPADPARLGQIAPERLRLVLAPSVHAFRSRHPAFNIWRQNQPGVEPAPLPKGPEFALLGRTPGFAVATEPLDALRYAVLEALLAGKSFAEAVHTAPGADPTPLLALLIRHQLFAEIGEMP